MKPLNYFLNADLSIITLVYTWMLITILVSVAFITLFERKILGYAQVRMGPFKAGWGGFLQPFADAIKLLCKENFKMTFSNKYLYMFSPAYLLILALLMFLLYYWKYFNTMSYELLFFMIISSFNVYGVLGAGWSSNSKYALVGAYRSIIQMISYEVSLSFLILSIIIFNKTFNLKQLSFSQSYIWFIFIFWNVLLMWLISILAETNRTPFDFAESESELVSGFNVEYGATGFMLLFLAEYSNILMMSYITAFLFFKNTGMFNWKMGIIMYFYMIVRSTFARFRIDTLMNMAWKYILPYSLLATLFSFNLKHIPSQMI